MSKSTIYNELFESKIITTKDFIVSGEKPYTIYLSKILSNPELFDNITLLTEYSIKNFSLEFDKICATSVSAIPYVTNVATSINKGILYISDEGNDKNDKDNIKNLTIEGGMNIDDRILLIETIVGNDFHLNNIIQKITKYGGNVVGTVIIINLCEGEYINLVSQNEKIINVLNIYDIFNHLENNNKIDLFYCERTKFYCEKITKLNIKKLLENDAKVEEVKDKEETSDKMIFVSQ
jgi:orotate phosphoribosyltransferase